MKPDTLTISVPVISAKCRISLEIYSQNDAVSHDLRLFGVWHRSIYMYIQSSLKPGMVFVDVGAHIGYFTVVASKLVGNTGIVIAFEPESGNRSILQRNITANSCENVTVFDRAVSDHEGEASFLVDGGNRAVHGLVHSIEQEDTNARVRVTTLATALSDLQNVDLIKVDVQGFDYAVLNGLRPYLARNMLPRIIFEFNPKSWQHLDNGFNGLKSFISEYGYEILPFIHSIGVKSAPPRLEWETFLRMANDILKYGHSSHELDVLLAPKGYSMAVTR